jgi:hypothetical protein
MILLDLSSDALEIIFLLLLDRHLIRLYLTGSRLLQMRLFNIRHRKFHDGGCAQSMLASPLVTSLLIGRATSVTANWRSLKRLEEVVPARSVSSSVRHLKIRDRRARLGCLDAARLNALTHRLGQLETLDIGKCYFGGLVKFPPAITSLRLHFCISYDMMKHLRTLPLTHLAVGAESDERGCLKWMRACAWFNTLESLSVDAGCNRAHVLADRMPVNLHELNVNLNGADQDLASIVSNQTRLQSLRAGSAWSISSPLPSTLTQLRIKSLTVDSATGLVGVAEFMPASLVSLKISFIYAHDRRLGISVSVEPSDFFGYAVLLLPRLNLESAFRIAKQSTEFSFSSDERCELRAMIGRTLESAGYSHAHLNWLVSYDLWNADAGDIEHTVAYLFKLGVSTRRDVILYLRSRDLVITPFDHVCPCGAHYESAVKCLEWNLANHLVLFGEEPPSLTDDAIGNLHDVHVFTDKLELVETFLKRRDLPSLRKIVVRFATRGPEQCKVMGVIDIIYNLRRNFPTLEEIQLNGWNKSHAPLTSQMESQLEEMRFVRGGYLGSFIYSVRSTSSEIN